MQWLSKGIPVSGLLPDMAVQSCLKNPIVLQGLFRNPYRFTGFAPPRALPASCMKGFLITNFCQSLYDETNPKHKCPDNNAKDLPDNIRFGDALGSWENEFEDSKGTEWITEFVCGGAKSYSYKTNKGKVEIKQKGITLDYANSNIFTFDKVKEAVLNDTTITSEKRYQFSWNTKTKDIETKYMSRTFEGTIDSKRNVLPNNDTLPFGHQDNLN